MVQAAGGAMARALVASSLVLARLASRCNAFVAAGIGSTSCVHAPRVSSTRALGTVGTRSASDANCRSWGLALAGGNARRRRGAAGEATGAASGASSFRSTRSSAPSMPLKMMAGECVGGTDISRALFVSKYNIMTSPCAEGCLNKKILDEFGIFEEGEETWEVDSCSTGGGIQEWYKTEGLTNFRGQDPDPRVEIEAAQRKITTRGLFLKEGGGVRALTPADLDKYDFVLGIDEDDVEAIMEAAGYWGKTDLAARKTRSLLSYCTRYTTVKKIPNPYYAGPDGFEHLVNVIEHAVDNLWPKCLRGEALSYD